MKTKIKKYLKEAFLFFVLFGVMSMLVSFYRTSNMHISNAVCHKGGEIVYFWGAWCPVCKMTSSNVERISKRFDVLGIAVRSGNDTEVRRYMQEHHLHFKNLNDEKGVMARQYGVNVFPTLVFCKDGKIKMSETGYMSTLGLWLRSWLIGL